MKNTPAEKLMTDYQITEYQYLKFFRDNVNFGPAHEDIMEIMNKGFEAHTGLVTPRDYRVED